jgi:hypothetical protein
MPLLQQNLRGSNRRIGSWLNTMLAQQGWPPVPTSEQMSGLLSELVLAGAWLRAEPIPAKGTDPELDDELDRYRQNVQRLRQLLPCIHTQLLAERARIEAQRSRIHSAAKWAGALRQTL